MKSFIYLLYVVFMCNLCISYHYYFVSLSVIYISLFVISLFKFLFIIDIVIWSFIIFIYFSCYVMSLLLLTEYYLVLCVLLIC